MNPPARLRLFLHRRGWIASPPLTYDLDEDETPGPSDPPPPCIPDHRVPVLCPGCDAP